MKHMSSVQSGKMIVGTDIGTSKVVALVGEVTADGELEIVGIGTPSFARPEEGRGGEHRIHRAVDPARHRRSPADGWLPHPFSLRRSAGNHIRSLNSHGIVAIRDREVSTADLERVLDAAQAVAIPADQRVLHTLPQDYVIDNRGRA